MEAQALAESDRARAAAAFGDAAKLHLDAGDVAAAEAWLRTLEDPKNKLSDSPLVAKLRCHLAVHEHPNSAPPPRCR